jgi:hypothetical protein
MKHLVFLIGVNVARSSPSMMSSSAPYRVSAREPTPDVIPPPSRRLLLHPLKLAIAFGGACLMLIVSWSVVAPVLFGTTDTKGDTRFVPMVDTGLDALQIGILISLFVLLGIFVIKVIPRWRGLELWKKPLYILSLIVAQVGFIAVAEAGAFTARGGIRLFEPHHIGSTIGPRGQSAHVYKDGFLTCHYDVYVSGVLSPTMKREISVNRKDCSEPEPTVKWNEDGSVRLVDQAGAALEQQQQRDDGWPSFASIFAFGC